MAEEIQTATPWFKVRHRYEIYIDEVMVTKESSAYVWVAWSSSDISKGYPGSRCKKISEDTSYFKDLDKAIQFAELCIKEKRDSLKKSLNELKEQEADFKLQCIKLRK